MNAERLPSGALIEYYDNGFILFRSSRRTRTKVAYIEPRDEKALQAHFARVRKRERRQAGEDSPFMFDIAGGDAP